MKKPMDVLFEISDLNDERCKLGDMYNMAYESLKNLKRLNEDSARYGKLIALYQQVIEELEKQDSDLGNKITHLANQFDE